MCDSQAFDHVLRCFAVLTMRAKNPFKTFSDKEILLDVLQLGDLTVWLDEPD